MIRGSRLGFWGDFDGAGRRGSRVQKKEKKIIVVFLGALSPSKNYRNMHWTLSAVVISFLRKSHIFVHFDKFSGGGGPETKRKIMQIFVGGGWGGCRDQKKKKKSFF